ncbi:Hydroxyacylglutathione hydrolase [bioreactor metagenome]|uniref:Hydroxyacylglutathione hydrolase n=1 Tax=bioreactor metagenome TaxID=1076179 RepID=A0A645A643_9ZZZZ
MVQEILPGIFRIPVPLVGNPLKELNSYLIQGKSGNLLIDTGFRQEPCRQALEAGLKEIGARREDTDVLLTHLHADHSGLAPEFAGEGRRIFISEVDRPYLEPSNRNTLWSLLDKSYIAGGFPPELLQVLTFDVPSRSMAPSNYSGYEPLKDDQVLEAGDYRLRAVLTPGHTPGHMCFWMEEQKVMFTGDHVLFDISPNITAWAGVEDSLGDYLSSLRALRDWDVSLALPSHRQTGNFSARIDELLHHHEERLAEALEVIRSKPGLTAYEVAGHMTWKIRADSWESFPGHQKWFAVGECLAHLDYLEARGLVRYEADGPINRYFA